MKIRQASRSSSLRGHTVALEGAGTWREGAGRPHCPEPWPLPHTGTGSPSPAHKMHLAPTEDVQDEALVRVGKLHVLREGVSLRLPAHRVPRPGPGAHLVSVAVGQVQLRLLGVEEHAGLLGHHLGVHGLVGLHADH